SNLKGGAQGGHARDARGTGSDRRSAGERRLAAAPRRSSELPTVFLGTSQFAAAILEHLARSEAHRPALVVTRPDRPRGRGRRATPPPVAERARELGIAL